MRIQNSSGLLVEVPEAVPPTVGNWLTPSWTSGKAIDPPNVANLLSNAVSIPRSGMGWFGFYNKLSGTQGTISIDFVTGVQGTIRSVAVLTNSPSSLTPRIELFLDEYNRPRLVMQNDSMATVAFTQASYAAIPEGTQVSVVLSWDSTQAIDGTRFARLQVRGGTIPDGDWLVSPTSAWASFRPAAVCLGWGLSLHQSFNGQILFFQASEGVYLGSDTSWSTPSTHLLECFAADTISTTYDIRTTPPVYSFTITASDSVALSDLSAKTLAELRTASDSSSVSDSTSLTKQRDYALSDTAVVSDSLTRGVTFGRTPADTLALTDSLGKATSYVRPANDTVGVSDNLVANTSYVRSGADAVVVTDAKTLATFKGVSDSVGLTDSASWVKS